MPGVTRFPGLDWTFAPACPEELAEACGHAWVQARAGGSVTLTASPVAQPWWLQLRAWLPPEITLQIEPLARETDSLPQRPFPPIHLSSLPRDGVPPWGTAEPLAWLAARESWLVVADDVRHPAALIAWAAVASWGWRVVCRVSDLAALAPALPWIAQRQLPVHLWLAQTPTTPPSGWQMAIGDQRALWLQHEWPTLHVAALPRARERGSEGAKGIRFEDHQ
jgi:hypothetical protein